MSEIILRKAGRSPFRMLQSALSWLIGSTGRSFVVIFLLAFGVRAYMLTNISPRYLLPPTDRELGAIARSLSETGQFSNPYIGHTGPTAHLPPIMPALLAIVYVLFGRTITAGYLFAGFIIMASAAMYAMTPLFANGLGLGKPVGFIAGIAGAFWIEPELSTHGESLAGFLLALILVAFLARWNKKGSSLFSSLMLGLVIGVSFHVQPAFLLVFLGCLLFEIILLKGIRRQAMTGILALGVVLACIPWAVRNYVVFHEFFFIRSNLGLELRMGNHDGAAAAMEIMDNSPTRMGLHPRLQFEEARKLEEEGEMEYMQQALGETLAWVRANPGEFIKLTVQRFFLFWFGPMYSLGPPIIALLTFLAILGLIRILPGLAVHQRVVILVPLITYPLIYYLVPFFPRWRIPIDWMILLLATVMIWHLIKTGTQDLSHG